LRIKIEKKEKEFLTEYIEMKYHDANKDKINQKKINWEDINKFTDGYCDKTVAPVDWIAPGCASSLQVLDDFFKTRLNSYADKRNDPTLEYCSDLSPFLHYGQVDSIF
jgi:deoxyribodipyrimidine photo-lyase